MRDLVCAAAGPTIQDGRFVLAWPGAVEVEVKGGGDDGDGGKDGEGDERKITGRG